jgi:F-type H+/Na+-transporting ATPase subunit alpha
MTELTIRPEEIRDAIERNVESYAPATTREEVGRVIETGDGIARVEGLHSAMTNELLEFEGGLLGLALNLDVREIGTVLLGDGSRIEEGQAVRRTGEVLSVPVGDGFLGRVVDPLGNPIDGKGPIEPEAVVRSSCRRPRSSAPAGQGAHADRHQGHRRHDGRSVAASAS